MAWIKTEEKDIKRQRKIHPKVWLKNKKDKLLVSFQETEVLVLKKQLHICLQVWQDSLHWKFTLNWILRLVDNLKYLIKVEEKNDSSSLKKKNT